MLNKALFATIGLYFCMAFPVTAQDCSFHPFAPLFFVCEPEGGGALHPVGLHACNESGDRVLVNAAVTSAEGWTTVGWREIENQACAQVAPSLNNTRIYLYAVNARGQEWTGNHPLCVNSGSTINADSFDFCASTGGMIRDFFSVWTRDMLTGQRPRHLAVTLGSNRSGLDHPRAER